MNCTAVPASGTRTRRLLGEALTHIMAAQDFEQAASVIEENMIGLIDVYSRSKAASPLKLDREASRGNQTQPSMDRCLSRQHAGFGPATG